LAGPANAEAEKDVPKLNEGFEGEARAATITIRPARRGRRKLLPKVAGKELRRHIDRQIVQMANDPQARGTILEVEDHRTTGRDRHAIVGDAPKPLEADGRDLLHQLLQLTQLPAGRWMIAAGRGRWLHVIRLQPFCAIERGGMLSSRARHTNTLIVCCRRLWANTPTRRPSM
jgi:hypothetical protein